MTKGIDVSYAQGKINWKKVKEDNIEFAFIRIGYGREINQKDVKFDYNYTEAKAVGIPIGGYHYSYATTIDRAKQEAKACLQMIEDKKFDLPIAYDMEESSQYSLTPSELYNIYYAFAEEIIAAGHRCMLYTNLNWMKNKWSKTNIISDGIKIWMAQYNSTMDYTNKEAIHIWQYSSKGNVKGITDVVDMNNCLIPLEDLFENQIELKNEWIKENGKYWYRHVDGSYTTNDWEQIDGKWYFFDSDGWMKTGWIEYKGKWYYLKSDGSMASDELLVILSHKRENELYAFAKDGHMMISNGRGALN